MSAPGFRYFSLFVLTVLAVPVVDAQEPTGWLDCKSKLFSWECPCAACVDWKTVPLVRPAIRPGFFTIPPSGPGYYSLLDQCEGNYRDKAPTLPWGTFAFYQPSFFDTDFRYLEKEDNTQHDFWDPLKRIHPNQDWLLSLGGQTWARYMNETESRLGTMNNIYTLFRTRLYADLGYKDCFRVYAEGLYADSFWQDLEPLPIDIDRGDFLNLFVEAKLGTIEGKPVYVRVGRQELLFGSQRLISTLDWANTRRTFQGIRGYRQGENWDVDLFWVQPVIPNRNHIDSVDNDQNFFGAWTTYRPKKGTTLDLYYLYLDQTRAVAEGSNRQRGGIHVSTVGSRFAGDQDNFLWDCEGMLQFGDYANQDLFAGAFTLSCGYHFKEVCMNPQLWVAYDYASGESHPGVGNERGTFQQLFPFGHYYFGFLDLVGRQNIHDISGQFVFYPQNWITSLVQLHHFRLDSPRDFLYNAANRSTRRDPTGRAGTDVGTELDLLMSFHLGTHTDLAVGWSKLWSGSFITRTGPDVSPELLYVQLGYRW
jgi:hypothetical protein